jgi:hypothetical protein
MFQQMPQNSGTMKWYSRWAVVVFVLMQAPVAWAFNPDAGAVALIIADALVTGKAIASPPPAEAAPRMIAVSTGVFDIGEPQKLSTVYGAEYRFGGRYFWNSRPVIGLAVTPHRTAYGYGGLRFSLALPHHLEVASDFALAVYSRGNGKDLGSAKEFYFETSVAYRFANDTRIELAARHLSHDGLFSSNDPGTDMFAVSFAFPLK